MAKSKSKSKNPFVGYTLEEVKDAEQSLYVILLGRTIYSHPDGKMTFSKRKVEEIFEVLHAGLSDMLKNGTFEEREDAREVFKAFRIMPLRFN